MRHSVGQIILAALTGVIVMSAHRVHPLMAYVIIFIFTFLVLSFNYKQRKSLEQKFEQSQKSLSMVNQAIENALYAFDIVDAKGMFIYVNKAYIEMWGFDNAEEILGTSPASHCVDENTPHKVIQALQQEGKCIMEFQAKKKDGSVFDVLMYARVDYDINGNMIFPTTSIDVTQRNQSEKRLLRAKQMETVAQLAGGIAHDFNNILGIILGHLNLLKRSIDSNESAVHRINIITQSAERAASLTRQLLSLARRKSNVEELVNLNSVIRSSMQLLERSMPDNIKMLFSPCEQLCIVKVDTHAFEDTLINLAFNARDSMPEGGIICISTERAELTLEQQAQHCIVMRIKDQGVGIEPQVFDQVFTPFFSTKPEGKGTGLGLAMVSDFVKQSNGSITIESSSASGTCFALALPEVSKGYYGSAFIEQEGELIRGQGELILLIDDEIELLAILKESLEDIGYTILSAGSAQQAMQLFQEHAEIKLVISDIILGESMTGVDLMHAFREHKKSIPALFTSAFAGNAEFKTDTFSPPIPLIAKPYSLNQLSKHLNKQLNP